MPMPQDLIQVVNEMGRQEGMLDAIKFCNIHKESSLLDLYIDDDFQEDKSCVFDTCNSNQKKEENTEKDLKKLEFDINVDDNEIKDLNDEHALHLNDGLADNTNTDIEDIEFINKNDDQHNHFGAPDDSIQQQNHHFERRIQQNLDVDNKDDDDNSQFNVVGDEESSADNNNDKRHDSFQHETNSYFNSGNKFASKSSYQDDDTNVKNLTLIVTLIQINQMEQLIQLIKDDFLA